ncbi:Uncharacterised protein [Salmonella enterica subsp. enterica]|uniref:Uncharacterized protein n=1 Tax=Salmonella enterica I TaxID=59201 RepID=A0A3S4IT81_SALET|nr:Uncharacterised protein [Salmonella enterica subsp. enterica]
MPDELIIKGYNQSNAYPKESHLINQMNKCCLDDDAFFIHTP